MKAFLVFSLQLCGSERFEKTYSTTYGKNQVSRGLFITGFSLRASMCFLLVCSINFFDNEEAILKHKELWVVQGANKKQGRLGQSELGEFLVLSWVKVIVVPSLAINKLQKSPSFYSLCVCSLRHLCFCFAPWTVYNALCFKVTAFFVEEVHSKPA